MTSHRYNDDEWRNTDCIMYSVNAMWTVWTFSPARSQDNELRFIDWRIRGDRKPLVKSNIDIIQENNSAAPTYVKM